MDTTDNNNQERKRFKPKKKAVSARNDGFKGNKKSTKQVNQYKQKKTYKLPPKKMIPPKRKVSAVKKKALSARK